MSTMSKVIKNKFKKDNKWTKTEKGALARSTTKDSTLDLFSTVGALRSRSESEIRNLVDNSVNESLIDTFKIAFYSRDIKQGVGERNTSRVILKHLSNLYPEKMNKLLPILHLYGRWDDYYAFLDTPIEKSAFKFLKNQLNKDLVGITKNKPISLLAKWLKSPKTSSKVTTVLGRKTWKLLGYSTEKLYRKDLSKLREYLKVTEKLMSSNSWESINFESVPSLAMSKYKSVFATKCSKFSDYINDVKTGKAKINSSVLVPSQLVKSVIQSQKDESLLDVINEQWKALPDYVNNYNSLCVCDTSGSMYDDRGSIYVALGLTLYLTERTSEDFRNYFISFSENPEIHKLTSKRFSDRVLELKTTDWGYTTNLIKVFNLLLDLAVKNKVPKKDMVESIIIISDMEFDEASSKNTKDYYHVIKDKFKSAGYKVPNLIFWNVNSRNNVFHLTKNKKGVQLVSGSSPAIITSFLSSLGKSPIEYMRSVLDSDRYHIIEELLTQ